MTIKVPNFTLCETTGKYQARRPLTEDQIIRAAKRVLAGRVRRGATFTSSTTVKDYLVTYFAEFPNEVFLCLFLDSQHQLIKSEVLFQGTINTAPVYPREVVRRCLELNAAAVILAHNHPSGQLKPSAADIFVTNKLKEALNLIGTNTLDHVIAAGGKTYSFFEHGRL